MKKFLMCLMALVMLVPLLVACENSETDAVSGTTSKLVTDDFVQQTPTKDMQGREFRVLCWDFCYGSNSILGYSGEVLYAEENPSSVDEAKKWVIDQVEAQYNCTITGLNAHDESVASQITTQVLAGTNDDTDYHLAFDSVRNASTLVLDGNIHDLTTISTIDLSKSWWDQNAVEDLSIDNKVYFTCGAINTYDDLGTWCMLFNKNLANRYIPDVDLYGLARDKKWTFDKFYELCTNQVITHDSSADGILDEKDTWAFGTETYNIYVHVISAGEKIAKKDENDLPYITLDQNTASTYNVLGKVLDFYNDSNTVLVADNAVYASKFASSNCWEETVHKAFVSGRELFYMCGLIHAASFREMEDEFGILPIPLYYEGQDRYYHTVSVGNSTCMFIPTNVENVEDVGLIASAISELSEYKLTPAFYDVQLKYRDTRDNDSAEMLDIIFGSRTFDLGSAYNWGSLLNEYQSMSKNYTSRFDSKIGSAVVALEKDLLKIQ